MTASLADRITAGLAAADRLLPALAGPVERAVLAAELAAFALYAPAVISDAQDPWACPPVLLPWLADALSVDVWETGWSEIEQRREIAASPESHRRKGTRAAIAAALARLGAPATITEWWEVAPTARRGTFRIFLDVVEVADTLPLRRRAIERVRTSKPKSRVVDVRLGIGTTGPIGIAAACQTRSIVVCEPFVLGDFEETGPIGIAAATLTRTTLTAEPRTI